MLDEFRIITDDEIKEKILNKRITDLEATVKSLCNEVIRLKKHIAEGNPVMAVEFIKKLNKSLSYKQCSESLVR